jgi:hypothetical protein
MERRGLTREIGRGGGMTGDAGFRFHSPYWRVAILAISLHESVTR